MSRSPSADYWNRVIAGRQSARPQRVWRAHSDSVNLDLCDAWWPSDRPARVLKTDLFDEASGVGLLPVLAERADVVCGIDFALDAARAARARCAGTRAAVADVRHLPFRDDAFDLIVSNSTIDHFDRADAIEASLREFGRVLAPGGRLILTLDNPVNPLVALRNALPFGLLNRIGLVPYYVGATSGPRRGRRLLADAGFRVLHVGAILHCPRVLAVASAAAVDRLRRPWLRRAFLRLLKSFERLERRRTRFLTGYYVAFIADHQTRVRARANGEAFAARPEEARRAPQPDDAEPVSVDSVAHALTIGESDRLVP